MHRATGVDFCRRLGDEADQDSNLLSLGAGTIIVHAPVSYADSGNWSPMGLIDELPKTGWATKGGDKARLSTHGFGSSQPVSSNDTTLGRSENRRVEIVKQ